MVKTKVKTERKNLSLKKKTFNTFFYQVVEHSKMVKNQYNCKLTVCDTTKNTEISPNLSKFCGNAEFPRQEIRSNHRNL